MASGAAPVAPDLSARPLATDMRFLFLVLAATALQAGKSATLKNTLKARTRIEGPIIPHTYYRSSHNSIFSNSSQESWNLTMVSYTSLFWWEPEKR